MESKSSHPMAAALMDFARDRGIEPKPEKVTKFENFPGEGISGCIEGKQIHVGNWKIASRAGCPQAPQLEGCYFEGKSVGYVFLGATPAGVFCLSDQCRTGAKEALDKLKLLGIKTVMLTGDSHAAANQTQDQLGGSIEVIHAELLPEDKARIITELQNKGRTAMIGDGVNDAPALATADIGISMGVAGSALATETGDIVLMTNDIQRIPKAVLIARQVRRKIIENVIISISTKAAIVGLAIAGHPLVWAAVLTDVGTCLLVIFNSMLLLQGTPTRGKILGRRNPHEHNHRTCKTSKHSCHSKDSCSDDKSCLSKKCSLKSCSHESISESCKSKESLILNKRQDCHTHCHSHNEAEDVKQECGAILKHESDLKKVKNQDSHKHCCNPCNKVEDRDIQSCSKDARDLESQSVHGHAHEERHCEFQKCEHNKNGTPSCKTSPPTESHKQHKKHHHERKCCDHSPGKQKDCLSKCGHQASESANHSRSGVHIVESNTENVKCCDSLRETGDGRRKPETVLNGGLSEIVVE